MDWLEKIINYTIGGGVKWKIVVGITLGILVSCSIFFGVMMSADIDEYIYEYKETPRLYEFYNEKVGLNQTSVFLIGNSQVGDALYAPLINTHLKSEGYNITSYNLFVSGDSTVRRATQIQEIIDSAPALVVYGVSYRDFVYGG